MEDTRVLYHIAVDGLPAIGKTALAHKLANLLGMHVLEEKMEDNPYLIYNFARAKNLHFQAQVYFAVSRFQQLLELKQWDLFSHGIFVDFTFERSLIYAQAILSDSEYYIFEKLYKVMSSELPRPDAILYLQASAEFAEEEIDKRGYDFEKKEIRKHLRELNQAFNNYFYNYCRQPVLVVNRERIDINSHSEIEGIAYVLKNLRPGVTQYISARGEEFFKL